jgi:hypothetical protein
MIGRHMKTYSKKFRLCIKKVFQKRKQDLKKAYKEANKDPDRLKTIKEWETIKH